MLERRGETATSRCSDARSLEDKLSKVAAEIIFLKKFENAGGDGQEDARQACARCACCLRPKGNCGCGHVPRIHTCHSRTMRSRHLHASPCLVCNTHHPDEALRWTSFVVGSRDAARSATSTSCTLPDTVIQLSTFERITLDTRCVCVCACAPLACAREIETLNVRALLDIDNIIERSVRAPSCDEHLRASTCLAANYLIGK